MDIRDFNENEIAEINTYIAIQIPQTILPSLFILTEEIEKKSKIFVAVYRIMSASKDYLENNDIKKKLETFLSEFFDIYQNIYYLVTKLDTSPSFMAKRKINKRIYNEMMSHITIINKLINSFLVFAEKIELISVDNTAGIKLDDEEGKKFVESIRMMEDV